MVKFQKQDLLDVAEAAALLDDGLSLRLRRLLRIVRPQRTAGNVQELREVRHLGDEKED